MMTGFKNFLGRDNSLSFKLAKNDAKASHMIIELTGADDYTVTALKINAKMETKTVEVRNGINAENLQQAFTAITGLYTRI